MYPSFRLQRISVLAILCWFTYSIMFDACCDSLSEPSTGMNSSNDSVNIFCNFHMTNVCCVMYRQNQDFTYILLFSEAQYTQWFSERRFLEKYLAMGLPGLTIVLSRLCPVEIIIPYVKGFHFKQLPSYRLVRKYSFENEPSGLALRWRPEMWEHSA